MTGHSVKFVYIALVIFLCFTSSISTESHAAELVGMVMDLHGGVTANGRRLELGAWVSAGDTVEAGRGTRVVVTFFFDRCRRIEMGERSALVVQAQEVRMLKGTLLSDREIQRCYRPQRLSATGGIGGDQFGMVMLRGGEERPIGFHLWMTPSNTYLRERQPTFRWARLPSISSYRVAISDASGKRVWETTTADTTFQYPSAAPELKRGQVYEWEVQGIGQSSVHRARFGTVHEEALAYIQEIEAACEARLKQATKDVVARVELALAYEGVGMREEAVIQYREALAVVPKNVSLHKAVITLYDEMLLHEDAAREKAILDRLEKKVGR
jgi:hypothetical protein